MDSVRNAIDNYDNNRVLNAKPPEINPEELTLSRRESVKLTRLRSGFSRQLKYYHWKIDKVRTGAPSAMHPPPRHKSPFHMQRK